MTTVAHRLIALVPAAALSLWVLAGCVPSDKVALAFSDPPTFNERIRLNRDRSPLGGQANLEVTLGPFRDGYAGGPGSDESQVVSELYPDLAGCPSDDFAECPTEKLLQADCYWAAAGENDPFDAVILSWEVLIRFARGTFSNELVDENSDQLKQFGFCRGGEPETGERAMLDFGEYDPEAAGVLLPGFTLCNAAGDCGFSVNTDRDRTELDFGIDLPFSLVEVSAVAPVASDGTCPQRSSLQDPIPHFQGDPSTPGLYEAVDPPWRQGQVSGGRPWCRPVETSFPACAYRCGVAPTADASYRLAVDVELSDTTQIWVERWMQPNVMVVNGRRKIRREMAYDDGAGELEWQTPVYGAVDTSLRWHENFSPNALVESVRVFHIRGGREVAVDLQTHPIDPRDPQSPQEPRLSFGDHTCFGEVTEKGVVFPIFNPQEEPRAVNCALGSETLLTTPTYTRDDLATATSPLAVPLRWFVVPTLEFENDYLNPPKDPIFFELTLRSEIAGDHAIRAPSLVHFKKQELYTRRSQLLTWRNVGSSVVEIDAYWIGGAHAGEFTARALGEPQMVPLPLELNRTAGGFSLEVIPGFENELDPLYTASAGFGAAHLRVREENHGGGLATVYGHDISFADGYPLLTAGPAQFPAEPQNGGSLPAGRPVYPPRSLPFQVRPGETFLIAVTAEPQGWGERTADLWVTGYPVADPSAMLVVASALVVEGAAAEAAALPEVISLPKRGSYTANGLLENPGSLPLVRGAISISGQHAQYFRLESAHDPNQTLEPGDSELFQVRYDPAGATVPAWLDYHQAQLEVATDTGLVTYQLRGREPLVVTPYSLSFTGGARVLQVELLNNAFHRIERQSLRSEGTDADLFAWANPSGYLTLEPGESETLLIEYTPRCTPPFPTNLANTRQAELFIVTDWGVAQVPLEGEFSVFGCS